jgi:hypothetical protein
MVSLSGVGDENDVATQSLYISDKFYSLLLTKIFLFPGKIIFFKNSVTLASYNIIVVGYRRIIA